MDESLPREPVPRPVRRRWRKPLIISGILCVGSMLVYAGWLLVHRAIELDKAEGELQEAIAEADRLDPGWHMEDLEGKRTAVPEDENSA